MPDYLLSLCSLDLILHEMDRLEEIRAHNPLRFWT